LTTETANHADANCIEGNEQPKSTTNAAHEHRASVKLLQQRDVVNWSMFRRA
jgi:hypothetical protein